MPPGHGHGGAAGGLTSGSNGLGVVSRLGRLERHLQQAHRLLPGAYKFDLKRCTPTSVDEVLRGLGADLVRVGGPISHSWEWNDGDTTTVSITVVQAGTCPAGSTAYTVTGTVTGGTSTYTQPGDAIHLAVCRRTAPYMYQVRLASGSSALL